MTRKIAALLVAGLVIIGAPAVAQEKPEPAPAPEESGPTIDLRQLPLPLVQRDDPDIPADAWVSRVISVPNGGAAWLVPILRPLIAQAGHLSAMPTSEGAEGSTKLLIVASYAKVQHITEIVELLSE